MSETPPPIEDIPSDAQKKIDDLIKRGSRNAAEMEEALRKLSRTDDENDSPFPRLIALLVPLLGVVGIVAASVAAATGSSPRGSTSSEVNLQPWAAVALIVIAAIAATSLVVFLAFQARKANAQTRAARAQAALDQELHAMRLKAVERVTGLATLLRLNQDQIDQYHKIATAQADKSFRSAQNAAMTGFGVIIFCVASGVLIHTAEIRWFLGGVGAIGAALSGFLNRTYLSMYRNSLSQFNRFFDQPVLTSYYLTAERLASEMNNVEDSENQMRQEIIRQVLATSAQLADASRSSYAEPKPRPA